MNLKKTEQMIQQKFENKDFDTYAILVHYGNEEKTFFSENADEFTYFDVASTGKILVTSALILQAISRGLLKLDSTLSEFFEIEDDTKRNITIQQLLTHSSGIIRYPITEEAVKGGSKGVADEIIAHPLHFAPGTSCTYSCNGFILLGYILEKIYGKPLEEIYRINIKEPLDLKRTAFRIGLDEPNAAVCYNYQRTEETKERFDDGNILMLGNSAGSGGQQSCLHDIRLFLNAVMERNELLYSRELFDLAEKSYIADIPEGNTRGLGYVVVNGVDPQTKKLFPVGSFGHTGFTGQSFFLNREKDLYVILLTNTTRCTNVRNHFKGLTSEDYLCTKKMREDLHNAIYEDLFAEHTEE